MKIVVAPDSFKGTYTARQVAEAIGEGIKQAGALPTAKPAADGGEGTLAALTEPLALQHITVPTTDPWGATIDATYGMSPTRTAVVEVAAASGHHSAVSRQPGAAIDASTYGTGVLIADAIDRGAGHVVVAAGGSATTDGGIGAITAVHDRGGPKTAHITVLTDVATTFGDAARVFAPQKGATPADVTKLSRRLADLTHTLPRDPSDIAGSGAAGGLAGGMWSAFHADLRAGADYVLDACGFDAAVSDASAVVVGEGRLDRQTQSGKLISAILRRAGSVPVYAVVGSTAPDIGTNGRHFAAIHQACNPSEMRRAGAAIVDHLRGDRKVTRRA